MTDPLEETRALWDDEAQTFDEAADHGLHDSAVREAWRGLMLDLLPRAPARVADLGCGTGTPAPVTTKTSAQINARGVRPEWSANPSAQVPVRVRNPARWLGFPKFVSSGNTPW